MLNLSLLLLCQLFIGLLIAQAIRFKCIRLNKCSQRRFNAMHFCRLLCFTTKVLVCLVSDQAMTMLLLGSGQAKAIHTLKLAIKIKLLFLKNKATLSIMHYTKVKALVS